MDPAALLCHICPKRPNFSDVSHLLTHVSSKAHLSNYFKLQVRSHQELHACDLIREYDRWYKVNNLAQLLADRMVSKEARKRKSIGKFSSLATAYPSNRDGDYKPKPMAAPPPSRSALPNFLDPRLSDSYLNAGPMPENGDISFAPSCNTPTFSSAICQPVHVRGDGPPSAQRNGERQLDASLQTPGWHKNMADKMNTSPRVLRSGLSYDPFVEYNDTSNGMGISDSDKERADEIARLKGVLWPGMDIFDSATEEMRRRRNQKKDEGILRMMEKTSLRVEPTELVFSPTGILRKQRVISGDVDDSSPLKGESPIPKRRSSRPKRGLLSQADPNVPRGRDRKRPRKAASYNLRKHSEEPPQFGMHSPSPTAPLPSLRRSDFYHARSGESEDLALSASALENKSRSGFTVFHDGEKRGMDFKDRSFTDGLPRPETMPYGSFRPPTSGGYVPNLAGRPYFHSGKENIEPLLGVHGRVDPVIGWSSPFLKRRDDDDAGYQPRYFVGGPQRVGLGAFDGPDMYTGYSCNPLAVPLSKRPADENHIYAGESPSDRKPRSASGPGSPEATISDIEQDDFERLYLDGSSY